MKEPKSKLALRYSWSYLIATAVGVILYVTISSNYGALLFLPLAPIYFPSGAAFLFGCYEVNEPIQRIIEYGLYIICSSLGILTQWRALYALFVLMLILNVGGCVVAGVEERNSNRPNPNQKLVPTLTGAVESGKAQDDVADLYP